MNNEQIVLRVQTGENVADNMLLLWENNKGLICSIAHSFHVPGEYEDLCQQGYFGLDDAVRLYDHGAGASFAHYAAYWIYQSMSRYLEEKRGLIRLPSSMRLLVRQYNRVCSELSAVFGRNPSDRELCSALLINPERLREVKKAAAMDDPASLSAPLNDEDSKELGDLVADPRDLEEETTEKLFLEDLGRVLWDAVEELENDQREVITAFYRDGRTMRDISVRTGCDVAKCYRIHNKALQHLRGRNDVNIYHDTMNGYNYYYDEGIKGVGVGRFNRTWTSATERAAIGN